MNSLKEETIEAKALKDLRTVIEDQFFGDRKKLEKITSILDKAEKDLTLLAKIDRVLAVSEFTPLDVSILFLGQ